MCLEIGQWTGTGRGTGTHGGCWARDRTGTAAGNQVHLLAELLASVPVLLRGFRAAAATEREHPAELHVEEGTQSWGRVHSIKYVRAVGQRLADPGTAKVLQGGGCVAGTDHLHTAFGCCGTDHGVELLVLKIRRSNPCGRHDSSSDH